MPPPLLDDRAAAAPPDGRAGGASPILPPWTAAAGALVLLHSLAASRWPGVGIPCLSRVLLHLPCPGCGLTRAMAAAWRGDLWASFTYHPLGLPVMMLSAFLLLHRVCPPRWRLRRALDRGAILLTRPQSLCAAIGLLLGTYAMRVVMSVLGHGVFRW